MMSTEPLTPSSGNAGMTPSSGNAGMTPSSGNAGMTPSSGNAGVTPSSGNAGMTPSSTNGLMASSGNGLSRDARLARLGAGLGLAAALALGLVLQPLGMFLPECVFHELTGVSCLTCGLTRSLESAARGDVLTAMQFHLMGPILLAGLLAASAVFVAEALTGRRLLRSARGRWQRSALLGLAVVWVSYGVIRAVVELL